MAAVSVLAGEFFAVVEDPNAGWREHMEDASARHVEDKFSLFGVFDGHGGRSCSTYCKENVLQRVRLSLLDGQAPEAALTQAFEKVNDEYCALSQRLELDDGSTATVLVLHEGRYHLAAAGDSRAVLVLRDGKTVALSSDHKPDRKDERQRVTKMGGVVEYDHNSGTYRVVNEAVGGLAVTRAIGDAAFKPFVTATPEVRSGAVDEHAAFVCIASDGLWDDLREAEVGQVLLDASVPRLEDRVKEMIEMAKSRGSEDNITCVAVDLQGWLAHERGLRERRRAKEAGKHHEPAEAAHDAAAHDAQRQHKRAAKKRAGEVLRRTIPGLDEDGYLSELLLWKSPLRSLLWFSVGCLAFFLTRFAGYSLLTLASYLLIMQIVITTAVVKSAPLLKRLRLIDADFDTTLFVLQSTLMSNEAVQRAAEITHQIATTVFSRWNVVVHDGSATNILVSLRFISYFFSPLPLDVVLFVCFIALFSLPATYHYNEVAISRHYQKLDATYQGLKLKAQRVSATPHEA